MVCAHVFYKRIWKEWPLRPFLCSHIETITMSSLRDMNGIHVEQILAYLCKHWYKFCFVCLFKWRSSIGFTFFSGYHHKTHPNIIVYSSWVHWLSCVQYMVPWYSQNSPIVYVCLHAWVCIKYTQCVFEVTFSKF